MRSEDLPAADRFPWWIEQVAKDAVPTRASSPHAADFRAELTLARLGPVELYNMTYPEAVSVRTPLLVRRSDPERYGLCLITANDAGLVQCGRESLAGPGDLLLFDTSQPFESRSLAGAGRGGVLILQLPKATLPLRSRRLDDLLARRLPASAGMNAILARYLTSVATAVENGQVGERESGQLGKVALDLATAALAAQVDAEEQLAPETRRQALLARVEVFIEHNLGDPDLTPAAIAAHHHISVSHLHRIFQARELTVAALIRRRRLERVRADLADPRLRARPVQAVAARWGFQHAADFNRAFRAAYGMPPGDYRRRVHDRE